MAVGRLHGTASSVLGYRALRRRLVTRLNSSHVGARVINTLKRRSAQPTAGGPLGIRPGRTLTGRAARTLPVVVIVATQLGPGDADRIARRVEHAQMMTGSFRPLFVIDNADFAPFRSRGFVVERVMRAEELASFNPDDSHAEYVFSRVRAIARDYGASSVVPLTPDALDSLPQSLTRLIGAVEPDQPGEPG